MSTGTQSKSNPSLSSEQAAEVDTVKHDAIVLLKQDHAAVKKLFSQYEKLAKQQDKVGKLAIAQQICAELIVHTRVEEEIFYPEALQAIQDEDMLNEAKVEHDSAKDLIAQIQSMNPDDALYDAKVKVLGEYINHHVQEEESEMFPKVRESKQLDLRAMGERLSQRKQALLKTLSSI